MNHNPRSTEVRYPFSQRESDYDTAPDSGFFLTVDYQDIGQHLPNTAANALNGLPPNGIACVLVSGTRSQFRAPPSVAYRRVPVPANVTGQR